MATDINYDGMLRKYKSIAKVKDSFAITEGFNTPTMGEMIEEDLAYDAIMQIISNIGGPDDPKLAAYYIDAPYAETPGYYSDVAAFVTKAKVRQHKINGKDITWKWGKHDGDTLTFYVKDLDAGSEPFTINGRKYNNIQEYYWNTYKDEKDSGANISSGPDDNVDTLTFSIRSVGIDCAEISHMEPYVATKKSEIITKTVGEIKNSPKQYVYWRNPITVNYDKYTYNMHERKDSDEVKLIKTSIDSDTGRAVYHEILRADADYNILPPIAKAGDNSSYAIESKNDNNTYVIIGSDETKKGYAEDGIKATLALKKLLDKSGNNITLVLDALALNFSASGTVSGTNIYYGSPFYTKEVVNRMIAGYKIGVPDLRIQGMSFSLYGADTYNRMLGAVYTQTPEGKWINANKFVVASTDHTILQKDYTSAELGAINGGISDAFQIWTYNKDEVVWLDSLEELSKSSYNAKMNLHKELSGMNLYCGQMRDYTVMIGDTLLMIPPTSIKYVTHTQYEKVGLLRAKGSMAKGGNHNERMIELDLFFAGDHGLNGIPYKWKFPSGEETTYYMNGLRGLISQFKFAPFLPIENAYINDVLGIEAVTMIGMTINTVEGFPGVLNAKITLKNFDYRVFMPELPLGIEQAIDTPQLAETTPVFAMSFQWEAFRYFYQRSLISGESLFKIKESSGYNSEDYNTYLYRMRTCLQPTTMCGSDIEFYIPDQNWLDQALNLKLKKDSAGVSFEVLDMTDTAKAFAANIGATYDTAKQIIEDGSAFESELNNIENNWGQNDIIKDKDGAFRGSISYNALSIPHVGNNGKYTNNKHTTKLSFTKQYFKIEKDENGKEVFVHSKTETKDPIEYIIKPIHDLLETYVGHKSTYTSGMITEEKWDSKDKTITLDITLPINTSSLSVQDLSILKEYIMVDNDMENKEEALQSNKLHFKVVFSFDGYTLDNISYDFAEPIKQLRTLKRIGDGDLTKETFNNDMAEELDYRDAAKLPFVPYMDKIWATDISIGFSNTYSDMRLQAVDGEASQYLGGSDAMIEIRFTTCDEVALAAITALPSLTFDMTTHFRKVMPAAPLRIKNELIQLVGINEALIEMINVDTVPEFPGAYEVTMRLSSVDRTLRQRETVRKLDIDKNGGFVGKGTGGGLSIKSYFDTNKLLASVELYPDLELPTLDDLRARGYAYIRYNLSNQFRVYPDPDFYMVYGNGYTAARIKKSLEDSFKLIEAENSDNPSLSQVQLDDHQNKKQIIAKLDDVVGLSIASQSANLDIQDQETQKLLEQVNSEKVRNRDSLSSSDTQKEVERHIKYLLSTDLTDGWKIKPGYQAPLCDAGINEAISKLPKSGDKDSTGTPNVSVGQVKSIRKKAIELIDSILSKPISAGNKKQHIGDGRVGQNNAVKNGIDSAIKTIFEQNSNGVALLKLLNPMLRDEHLTGRYNKPNIYDTIKAFMYASACVTSADSIYVDTAIDSWDYMPKMYYGIVGHAEKDSNTGEKMYLCKVESKSSPHNATSMVEALETGYMFGTYAIRTYTKEELIALTTPALPYKYVSNKDLYKHGIKDGFLDPYYNKFEKGSKEINEYKQGLMQNAVYSAEAQLRNILVWIRKMIYDGLFFSDLDVVANEVLKQFPEGANEAKLEEAIQKYSDKWGIGDEAKKMLMNPLYAIGNMLTFGLMSDELSGGEDELTELYVIQGMLSNSLPKSFCARMIYPFVLSITQCDPAVVDDMLDRNYEGLSSMAKAATSPAGGSSLSNSQTQFNFFFSALTGIDYLEAGDLEKVWADESQKMSNSMMKQVYVEASNNPKKYVMHSFYDMLMNDKRGRLVRAFPTFYMMLVDEGRKVGYWKLHDNFYNMSAISNMQIVKSRKIATDTCTLQMSNMYNSYAAQHSTATSQQYSDLYGIKDAIDNIFSPTSYYNKSEVLRSQIATPDTLVLKPGARIHARLGYGSDASRLPTAFNGKIAEINVGEVVDIVAQGDGHELMNPLNAFGSIEVNQLEPSQTEITAFKGIRGSFSRGGYSPRDLLAEVLSAEYGGLKKWANDSKWSPFNGRFFNDNPFGIVHYGDKLFTNVFEQGEVVQNLFEVSDTVYGKGYSELVAEPETKKVTPIINTSLYDKSFWDLLHICARAGKDYIGATRDFGFRSTVFLGRPNDYYAYEYVNTNGQIYEKRKPFQQFHYIDSYSDIVYNAMKATEKDMKTNAVGIWQASGWISGRTQETVGPVYLDQNIYPEYQKSMTYDTGLLADGNGGLDFLGIFKRPGEKFKNSEFDDKVNKELARRMTINALKDSVKDMYQGQLGLMGNPAIKPYDRIELNDFYESMSGAFEVESVIHSLSVDTGFTTTVVPDCIVRDINNPHEIAVAQLSKVVLATHVATIGAANLAIHLLSKKTRMAKMLAKSTSIHAASGAVNRHASKLFSSTNIDSLSEVSPAIAKLADSVGSGIVNNTGFTKLNGFKSIVDDLSRMSLSKTSSLKDMITYMNKLNAVDMDDYARIVNESLAKSNSSLDIKDFTQAFDDAYLAYGDLFNSKMNVSDTLKDIAKHDKLSNSSKQMINKFIEETGGIVDDPKKLKSLTNILDTDDVFKFVTDSKNASVFDKLLDSTKALQTFSNAKTGGISKLKNATNIKTFDAILDIVKGGKAATALINLAAVVPMVVKFAIFEYMIADIKDSFGSWFKNIQTLTVFPMKQYDRSFYAGMNGNKGSVYGAPPADGWNSIQGMVIQAYEKLVDMPGIGPVANILLSSFLIDENEFKNTAHQYKVNLGLVDEEDTETDIVEEVYDNVSRELLLLGRNTDSIKTRARIQSFDGTREEVKSVFKETAITSLEDTKLNAFKPVEFYSPLSDYVQDGKLKVAHNMVSKNIEQLSIRANNSNYNLNSIKFGSNKYDVPILRKDSLDILKLIMDDIQIEPNKKDTKVILKNGTRLNDSNWTKTGYQFIIGATKDIESSIKNVQTTMNNGKYKVFEYKKTSAQSVDGESNNYMIFIYPPVYNSLDI